MFDFLYKLFPIRFSATENYKTSYSNLSIEKRVDKITTDCYFAAKEGLFSHYFDFHFGINDTDIYDMVKTKLHYLGYTLIDHKPINGDEACTQVTWG